MEMLCVDFAVEEDCSVTNITGSLRHHQRKRRTKLQFSSGNPRATYRCKLDDEKFTNCEFTATTFDEIHSLMRFYKE